MTKLFILAIKKYLSIVLSVIAIKNFGIKSLTAVIFLMLFANVAQSQRRFYHRSYLGVYTGINLSGFAGEYQANVPGETGKIRLRTQYGIYYNSYVSEMISIFSALEYVLKGSITKGSEISDGTEITYGAKTNLSTLTLPVLFSFTPDVAWGFMIGPQVNYTLTAKEPWYKSDFIKPADYRENVIHRFNEFTFDGVIAVNYLLQFGGVLQMRFSYGINSIVNQQYGNARSYSIMLFAGLNLFRNKGGSLKGKLEFNSFNRRVKYR